MRFRPLCFYITADSGLQSVLDRVRAMGPGKIRLVVCDLSASLYIDLAGSRMLHQFHTELGSHGINLRIVGARGRVRDLLRAEGIDEKVGGSTGAKPSTSFWKAPARRQPGRHYPRGNHVEREDRNVRSQCCQAVAPGAFMSSPPRRRSRYEGAFPWNNIFSKQSRTASRR